jgi:hypothetical protein
MTTTENQTKAAGDIVDLLFDKTGNNTRFHPGTAITSASRLAGSFLFRTFNINMDNATPGSVVLSDMANEKGPVLMTVLGNALTHLGVTPDPAKLEGATNVPSDLNYLDTLALLQEDAHGIMKQHELTFGEMACSCAMATAFIIKECQEELPCESGYYTAVYGFVEGCKTYPPEFKIN